MIKRIEYKEAVDFLLPRHYSGRTPNIMYAFGVYEETEDNSSLFPYNKLVAVCTFGKPASNKW